MSTRSHNDPFHAGEREIQERLGVRDRLAKTGQRAIRDHLIDQHRAFYEQIPEILYGARDADGRLWASMLWGELGFMTSPDPVTLVIDGQSPTGDPIHDALKPGDEIGLLGLMFHTRRRNRASGRVRERDSDRLEIVIDQSFGNCPKYIQSRTRGPVEPHESVISVAESFGSRDLEMIHNADTFFIASQFSAADAVGEGGIDISHRGGKSGFIKTEGNTRLVWPDFAGNRFFNTLGNLLKNPEAGLLFLDFTAGDVLYLNGTAEILWQDETSNGFKGAERLVAFDVKHSIHCSHALPWTWTSPELSPFLTDTGSWA